MILKKKNGEKILYKSSRHREIIGALKKQIEVTSLHICELHYTEENFIRNEIRTTRVPYFTNEIIRIRKKRKIINKHSETWTSCINKHILCSFWNLYIQILWTIQNKNIFNLKNGQFALTLRLQSWSILIRTLWFQNFKLLFVVT